MQYEQICKMQEVLRAEAWNHLHGYISTEKTLDELCSHLAPSLRDAFAANTTKDTERMMETVASACTAPIVEFLTSCLRDPPTSGSNMPSAVDLLSSMAAFRASFIQKSAASLQDFRKIYLENSARSSTPVLTSRILADGTRPVYEFIRNELGIGLHGLDNLCEFKNGFEEPLIGDDVSRIYECIQNGRMARVLVKVFGEVID